MGSSKIRKALGAVKDRTSIGLAKVSNSSTVSDLEVAIVKATRHDEHPADEKHIKEILSLTCYSRVYVSSCVNILSRRLGKTRSWTVALKTLILTHRLLSEGDPAYEQEIFFATRRGTRMLNMSDFRDTSRSDAWDFSAFVRTYALYLDERLEFRMHGRRARRSSRTSIHEDEDDEAAGATSSSRAPTPVRDMRTDRIFVRTQHLQQILERFLACRPTGAAKNNRIVVVALYPLVKESFQIYLDLVEVMNIFIDRFMELEVSDCAKVYDIFCRFSKQFDELDAFYQWSRTTGIGRSSDYPTVEQITSQKLEVMDEFIRDRSNLIKRPREPEPAGELLEEPKEDNEYDMNAIKALPAPESTDEGQEHKEEEDTKKQETDSGIAENKPMEEEVDLLNLGDEAMSGEDHANKLALALFDGNVGNEPAAPAWEAFKDDGGADWETALMQSASRLSEQKAALGGGFNMMLLDGMYSQPQPGAATEALLNGGSASSVALPAPQQTMLALPAPPVQGGGGGGDPFAASLAVPPPSYVQMSEMEKKQQLLVEEQAMWQQYAKDGMQGQMSLAKLQQGYPHAHTMGGYTHMF